MVVVVFVKGTTFLATLALLKNLPKIGNDAIPAMIFIKVLLLGSSGPSAKPIRPPFAIAIIPLSYISSNSSGDT